MTRVNKGGGAGDSGAVVPRAAEGGAVRDRPQYAQARLSPDVIALVVGRGTRSKPSEVVA